MPGMAPTIHAVRELAQQYTAHAAHAVARGGTPAAALEMILDMHAHSTCMNGFIFANLPEDPREMVAVAAFPRCLANQAKDFSSTGCKFDRDESKAGTGRRALSEMLPGVHCYTLEISMFCAAQGNVRGEAYQPASYTQMGHAIGLALHECYCTAKGVVVGAPAATIATPPVGLATAQHDANTAAIAATATTGPSGAATTSTAHGAHHGAPTAHGAHHGAAATSSFAASAFAASSALATTASAGVGSTGVGSAARAANFPARAPRPMAGGTPSAPMVRGGSAWVGAGRVGGTGPAYSSVRCASRMSNA